MSRWLSFTLLAAFCAGCASQPCDRVQPYQQVRPKPALEVPEGLTEPRAASRAPQAEPGKIIRRADGRCLEQPPQYIPESEEAVQN